MATTFQPHPNNVSTTLASAHASGSGSLVVASGTGSLFGTTFPMRVTVATAATYGQMGEINTIFTVTARAGDTLTVSGAIEGTSDRSYAIGDRVDCRFTDGMARDIEAAINALEASVVYTTGAQSIAGAKTFTAQAKAASPAPGTVPFVVWGASGQTAHLQDWCDGTGAPLAWIGAGGGIQAVTGNFNRGSTATADNTLISTATWNNSGVAFAHWVAQVTDTASQATSNLQSMSVGGSPKWQVDKTGKITTGSADGSLIATGTVAAARLGSQTPSNGNWLRGDGAWMPLHPAANRTGNATLGLAPTFQYCDASSAGFTLTLPSATSAAGIEYIFFRADGTANVVTIQRAGTDVFWGGGTSMTLPATSGKFIRLVAVGPNLWIVVGSN